MEKQCKIKQHYRVVEKSGDQILGKDAKASSA
jgi:hypothetical protein